MIEVFTAVKALVREEEQEENDEDDSEARLSIQPSNLANTFGTIEDAHTEMDLYTANSPAGRVSHAPTVEVGTLEDNMEEDVYYPLDDVLDDALGKGLVVADVSGRIVNEDHVSFAVRIQMLNLPGLTEPYSDTKMFFLKKYTDFKAFHLDLSQVSDAVLPPLPSREIMSLGLSSDDDGLSFLKNSFLNTRQMYLKNWLNSILMLQSSESFLYRQVLKNFMKG